MNLAQKIIDPLRVVVAAGGRFHALHLAQQLERRGMLHRLISWSYRPDDTFVINKHHVRTLRFPEYLDQLWWKLRGDRLMSPSRWYVFKDNLFDRWLSYHLRDIGPFDLFVGWSNYVLHSLDIVRAYNIPIAIESGSMHILDQQHLAAEEYRRCGHAAPTLTAANIKKICAEYDAADIIMVPATHVKESFVRHGCDPAKIAVVPYGVNVTHFKPADKPPPTFRALYVGRVTPMKGIHYLLQAWNNLALPNAELIIIGPCDTAMQSLLKTISIPASVRFIPGVAHNDLAAWYQQAAVFVFPSIQEGWGMVLTEAMASGLPIITTNHTAGVDLITEGVQGFVVPIRHVAALQEKLQWSYRHRDALYQMGQAAARTVALRTWDAYGDAVVQSYYQQVERLQ